MTKIWCNISKIRNKSEEKEKKQKKIIFKMINNKEYLYFIDFIYVFSLGEIYFSRFANCTTAASSSPAPSSYYHWFSSIYT